MSKEEFLKKYHSYMVDTEAKALAEIEQMAVVEGHSIIPVHFPQVGWCLMLDTAYQEIRRLGIV